MCVSSGRGHTNSGGKGENYPSAHMSREWIIRQVVTKPAGQDSMGRGSVCHFMFVFHSDIFIVFKNTLNSV